MSNYTVITATEFFAIDAANFNVSENEVNSLLTITKGKMLMSDLRAKNLLIAEKIRNYFRNTLIEIKEDMYVKGIDFAEIVRIDNNKITTRFIGGLYNIPLSDVNGNKLNKNLIGIDLINFKNK